MTYYVIFYAYYCKRCKKNLYIVNAKSPSKGAPECPKCGNRTSFMGRVKALLNDFEEYRRIVEQRIYEELPVEERRPGELPLLKPIEVGAEVARAWRRWTSS
jgi:DNA-directed RNA polymerase subunit RPC12/RpoP